LELVFGGFAVAAAAFLAGATGFGFALISVPFLLLLGYGLEFIVTVNLTLTLLTRLSVSYKLRHYVAPRRLSMMILASIPGFYLGAKVLANFDASLIKLSVGIVIMVVALLLALSINSPPPPPIPGAPALAGFTGGILGATTSLSGIPPVLLLAHQKANQLSFLADLAVYFVISSSIALIVLATQGVLALQALFPSTLLWLPGAFLGTFLGTIVGPRLPEMVFRYLTLGLVLASGGITVYTS
jgi:uncharacterized membrane protein YfcA